MHLLNRHNVSLVLRIIGFIALAIIYLYIGYHIRDHIIDFSNFEYVDHPGIVEEEYVNNINEVSILFSLQSRWMTNIVAIGVLILAASGMLYLLFNQKKHFIIGIIFYSSIVFCCLISIIVGEGLFGKGTGYHIARFLKDNYIVTPFVFIFLASSLKAFKI